MFKERLSELGFVAWVVILLIVAMVLLGGFGLGYKYFVGTKSADIDRQIFENTKTYVKGMADDLAKYKYELATTTDVTARKAIIDVIIDRYADFDGSKLESADLRRFLEDIKSGNI